MAPEPSTPHSPCSSIPAASYAHSSSSMATREFIDPTGLSWTVWSVTPQEMSTALKRLTGTEEERRTPWLVFQSREGDKRRLAPIPDGWTTCDDHTLAGFWDAAVRVPPAHARRN